MKKKRRTLTTSLVKFMDVSDSHWVPLKQWIRGRNTGMIHFYKGLKRK